ncbi:hypothetical protein VNO80_24899 [Phaseolus coccineus]|uniref:Uncharacterized protein n=1 Tax=Phaseolus coccineus TaxID=3886 RepID=A0AAN9QST3_PHACN
MELSEECKSFFPVGSSIVAPLLLSNSPSLPLGPLLFNLNPNSLSLLFSSPSLLPSLYYPPYLLPSHFLLSSHPPSILPSTASSIASLFSSSHQNDAAPPFLHSRLHLLTYPHRLTPFFYSPLAPTTTSSRFSLSASRTRSDDEDDDASQVIGPHILEESVVLLESGQLFLFDLECCGTGTGFKGTRLKVPWNNSSKSKVWLSCEFSWHPRILVVARFDVVFLVDLRLKDCSVSCLMKIKTLRMYAPDENERFLVLSRAAPDNFYFVVVSSSVLLLCDVRKPLVPVLQWVHGIEGPSFMFGLSLSDLSSISSAMGMYYQFVKNMLHRRLTQPSVLGSFRLKINLSSQECHCGSCLLRKEFSKDALPERIDWQQKKEIVLGFGILSNASLCEPDENGGFTLIRLTSSGRFELQRYHASWAQARNLEDCSDQLAFLSRAECYEVVGNLDHNRVSLESFVAPNLPQLPPFFLRKSSPHNNDDIVGPVIPFPVLLVLNKFRNGGSNMEGGEFSVEIELSLKYKEVMQVAGEIAVSAYGPTHLGDHVVSLAEDGEETWAGSSKSKFFLLYRPVSFNLSVADHVHEKSVYSDTNYDTFISHVPEKKSTEQIESVGQEIFDDLSPVELRFDALVKKLEPLGSKAYDPLKR